MTAVKQNYGEKVLIQVCTWKKKCLICPFYFPRFEKCFKVSNLTEK